MLTFGQQKIVDSFNYFSGEGDKTITVACNMEYTVDLNGDGQEEVIFSGWETQPNQPGTYSNTQITIFGWQNGELKNLTNSFLPNLIGKIEGTGSLVFGDFNNDGKIDFFSSAYSDMDFKVNAYAFLNNGNGFTRQNLGIAVGQHDSAAADINGDGFCDVVATGYGEGPRLYIGGPNGLTEHLVTSFIGGSGIALGNFLGDGTVSMILSDHHAPSGNDTSLHKFIIGQSGKISTELIAGLPAARFDLPLFDFPEYGKIEDPWGHSHDIRTVPMDFDSDGLLDVIVISRPGWNGLTWPNYSEIQFLKNSGEGNFVDVTGNVRKNYQINSAASYAPKLADFNGDGLTDIFLSEGSWDDPKYKSTTILLQQSDGTFVDSYRSELSSLVRNYGGKAAIAKGPNDTYYLISQFQEHGGQTSVEITPLYFDGKLVGTDDQDILRGSANNDRIAGFKGNDQLFGLDGDDTLDGGSGNDKLDGGKGIDTVLYSDAAASIKAILAKNLVSSLRPVDAAIFETDKLKSIENIISGNYDDLLIGSKFANSISGNAGNDTIDGGFGNDTLIGGSDNDVFVFSSKLSPFNIDTIGDFVSGEDSIQLSSKIFSKLKGVTDYLTFGTASDSATHYLIYDITTGKLYYDADGNGSKAQIEVVEIGVGTNLQPSDVVVL